MQKKILVWFRNDLRLRDNEMLAEAIAKSDEILPVYVFDARHFEQTSFLTLKTGITRTKFIIESLGELKQSFKNLGGDLLVLNGLPEELIPKLVSEYQINEVYHHREVASEETAISTAVEDALWKLKVNLKHFIGHTLYNKEDLPFPIKDIPDLFTQFKKKTERDAIVKPCVDIPNEINFVLVETSSETPTAADLFDAVVLSSGSNQEIIGGESQAQSHLANFCNMISEIAGSGITVKKFDIISKLSAWLSLGCISPRQVYWQMKNAEQNAALKPYFNQVILGLLWRDYYRFMFKKYGNRFFKPNAFSLEIDVISVRDQEAFTNWKTGNTELPQINAVMKELNDNGYITNAARQLAAAYLIYEMKVNWVLGAAHFEEKLIDYSPASNWGNWANLAGVGNDQSVTQAFDFEKTLKNFDQKATHNYSFKV